MKKTGILLCVVWAISLLPTTGQGLKRLEHDDVKRWKKIGSPLISANGEWVAYRLSPSSEGDGELGVWRESNGATSAYPRAKSPAFSADSRYLAFLVSPPLDSLKALRRKKVKDADLPKDTLYLLDLNRGSILRIPNVRHFELPERWNNTLIYQPEAFRPDTTRRQTTDTTGVKKTAAKPKFKKENKENGYRLILRLLDIGKEDTIPYVTQYAIARDEEALLAACSGYQDSLPFAALDGFRENGLYYIHMRRYFRKTLYEGKATFRQLALSNHGTQAAFLLDKDTTKAQPRPWSLCLWDSETMFDTPYRTLIQHDPAIFPKLPPFYDPDGPEAPYSIAEHVKVQFSEDHSKLYFGLATLPPQKDTTLLPEEIVEMEVWSWTDKRFYPQQLKRAEEDGKRALPAVWHIAESRWNTIGDQRTPQIRFDERRNLSTALGINEEPYALEITHSGRAPRDLYILSVNTGKSQQIAGQLRCAPYLSPSGKYAIWWSYPDTAWYAWRTADGALAKLTSNRLSAFYDEKNDVPDYPSEYGIAAWLDDDSAVLLYDRYDIWQIDPNMINPPLRLTQGREQKQVWRYLKLDPEQYSLRSNERILLHRTDERSRAEAYAWFDLGKKRAELWLDGDYAYSRRPLKARKADAIVFTRENFRTFPDLWYADFSRKGRREAPVRVSRANPQQNDFLWGDAQLVSWRDFQGDTLEGLLFLPQDYDPKRRYPMLVNFYERSSDGLMRHRAPDFGRSSISASFYVSRGYVVFMPDVRYRTGYPGESALNAVLSGAYAMVERGYADPRRVGLQGHSWGGYQIAYILTRTNFFRCAEAGAPVANMSSAYGGIRTETGLSRSFQYERQQSRIGATLWEKPWLYIENSPLFALDKVQTPLLILQNDNDGAVPFQQGVELFNALRRLGKPAWMLNYNKEPHWPVKLQNRIDFQTRLQQFLDHYLLDAPMPSWMQRGLPAVEKGARSGLE